MHDAFMAFRECGWPSWLCLLIGLAGMGVGVVGVSLLATRARNAAWIAGAIAAALGVLSLGTGLLGREMGMSRVEAALSGESIDASQKARIRAIGGQEAGQCVAVGTATGALPFVMGALALGVGLSLRKKASS